MYRRSDRKSRVRFPVAHGRVGVRGSAAGAGARPHGAAPLTRLL